MSSAPALSRSLAPRAPRAFSRRFLAAAACLVLVGAARLSAQNPGDLSDDQPINAPLGFTYYTQILRNDTTPPSVVIGGDRFAFNQLNLSNGVINGPFNFSDVNTFGNAGRIVYTAVQERVTPAGGGAPYYLVGGQFGRSGLQIQRGQNARNIQRLTPAGLLDPDFNPGRGANNYVTSIVPLADGGMIVGGFFDQFNDQERQRIVRLDHAGAIVDNDTFRTGLNFDAPILSMAEVVNASGSQIALPQYVVAGQFSNVNGKSHQKLVRLNGNGTVDETFNPSFDLRTTIVYSLPDGKILVGGDFLNVNGRAVNHIVRLNYDGSVDTSFVASVTGQPPGFGSNPPAVYVIKQLADGRLYLGGNFNTVNGQTRRFLARVSADGELDPTFDATRSIINAVQSISIQTDGKLLVGEVLSQTDGNGKRPPSLVRIYSEPPVTILNIKAKARRALIKTEDRRAKKGIFRLRRSNDVSLETSYTVNVTLSGTATTRNGDGNGNFKPIKLPGGQIGLKRTAAPVTYQVTFPAGVAVLPIVVAPTSTVIDPALYPAGVTVTLTVQTNPSEMPAATQSATVTITND